MTKEKYSPRTQAVSDAIEEEYLLWEPLRPGDAERIAAVALRASVDAVADESTPGQSVWGEGFYEGVCSTCDDLLAIAKELEETK
jgi:hypothetical protein